MRRPAFMDEPEYAREIEREEREKFDQEWEDERLRWANNDHHETDFELGSTP